MHVDRGLRASADEVEALMLGSIRCGSVSFELVQKLLQPTRTSLKDIERDDWRSKKGW